MCTIKELFFKFAWSNSMSGKVFWVMTLSSILATGSGFSEDRPMTNRDWFPKKLNLEPLRPHCHVSPQDKNFNYAKAFARLDMNALISDLKDMMTHSQDWWPADYGTYAPFFIRMTWHSAGTYRIFDGRGGAEGSMQRFAPLNSWPDNANLDKARRLLWPIKQKYGNQISWSDLMVLTGNVAMESMGFKTIGFAGGRVDAWEPKPINWGYESQWFAHHRQDKNGQLQKPFAATEMGLIYVNAEGPNGNPDPLQAAKDIRVTFSRMAMNDEETVALIAGGHAFGKAHGAANSKNLGPSPELAPIEQQGLGWKNSYKTGKGPDTITSGYEGAWSQTPTLWSNSYLENLYHFNWVKTKSPAGATQWTPDDAKASNMVPNAYDANLRHPPMMFTTDLALKADPAYRKISERFLNHPEELKVAFANAWFKLTHRDMGPRSRYLGPLVPKQLFIWQDPIPAIDYQLVDASDIKSLKSELLNSGISQAQLIKTAWASASSFRGTDLRGGANGARVRLLPQINWPVNNPTELNQVLTKLATIQKKFNDAQTSNKKISLADLIVLGGSAAIEKSAQLAGYTIEVPFTPGRNDATQEMTDTISFNVLQPHADGFRNYYEANNQKSAPELLVDKASQLNLTVPEMTVLIGGMRVLNTNYDASSVGVLTANPGQLNNAFFENLLNMSTTWKPSETASGLYQGIDNQSGEIKWQASPVDLIFGSDSELRAVAEFYASPENKQQFVQDFVNAWVKVMNLDRFDLNK
jgi:catalase-peroxidase